MFFAVPIVGKMLPEAAHHGDLIDQYLSKQAVIPVYAQARLAISVSEYPAVKEENVPVRFP
jgi:hypothetical protein